MSNAEDCRRQLRLLRHYWKDIVADLDVNHVIPYLLQHLALVHDDKERVEAEVTLEDKADKLLNIIESKAVSTAEESIIRIFIDSLRSDYFWLHQKFTEDVPDFKGSPKLVGDEEDKVFESPKHLRVKTMLEAGGVQCLPAVTVYRHHFIETIQMELRELKRHQYLVVQGMAGSGKSVLATQALNSAKLITNIFPDGVFVLSIGKECSESKDAILAKMRILCERLEEVRAPISLEHGAELLKAAFLKRAKALLVLDGVWRPEVIRAFDVGCSTMVTTRDLSVMDVVNGRVREIKISNGFTEAESLELFRSTLQFSTVRELPEVAKSIHSSCQGSPMVVSLISSLLLDHQGEASDEGRWKYYLDSLTKRKYSKMRRARDYEHQSVFDAISLSFESLSDKQRKYYSDFALFQDDVGIPSPVLEVLWCLERYEVGDIMKDFVRKSLASEEYNPIVKWNVYSINNLLLDYVKYQVLCVEDAEKKLHARLIDRYLEKSEYLFHKLPDDNYIHFYLGYHLYKSGKHHYFPDVYLDILFIGEKIRITGPADLLVDIRKYQEFIVGGQMEKAKLLEEIQSFTQLVGHRIYGQTDVDIVQVALQYSNFSLLSKIAENIALQQPNRLYLTWKNGDANQWKNAESTTLCSDGVRCVKFVGSMGNHFLAGLNNGDILLCDIDCCGICHTFSGHTDTVQSLSIYRNTNIEPSQSHILLSASEDKTCKLWDLRNILVTLESKTHEAHTPRSSESSPSPKIRSDKWAFEKLRDDSFFTFEFHTAPLTYAELSASGSLAVSSSLNEIMVWNTANGQVLYKNSPDFALLNTSVLTCHFGPDWPDYEHSPIPYLLAGVGNQIILYSLFQNTVTAAVDGHHMNIVAILLFSSTAFCTVSENEIGLWKIEAGESGANLRRRSLSPRKSYPMANFPNGGGGSMKMKNRTQADAFPLGTSSAKVSGNFLLPPTRNGFPSEGNNDEDTTGRKVSSSTSDCYSPTIVTTALDNGSYFVRISREEIIYRRSSGSGLFQCAAIAQDRDLIACGTSDRRIFLWNMQEKYCIGEFSSHAGWLRCLDFSKVDDWTLLSGSEDHTVMVWDLKEESEGRKVPQKNPSFTSVFIDCPSDEGYFLSVFSTDADTVQIYQDTQLIHETPSIREKITVVAVSDDGRFIAGGTANGRIFKKNIQFRRKSEGCPGNDESAGSLSLSNSDLDNLELEDLIEEIQFLKFDPSGIFLVVITCNGIVSVFKNFQSIYRLVLNSYKVIGLHFPFNKFFSTVSRNDKANATINMIELETGKPFRDWVTEEIASVTCSALKIDSSCIAVGTAENGVLMCTLRLNVGIIKMNRITCKHNSGIKTLAFSSDGCKLAVGHENGLITIWNLHLDTFTEERNLLLHKARVRTIVFSPFESGDSRWLISCGDKLAFWSVEKPCENTQKTSFMAERRRKKSGDSRPPSRLSLEISPGIKIGKQGKRELLQTVAFRGTFAKHVVFDPSFTKFVFVDDTGIYYLLETVKTPLV